MRRQAGEILARLEIEHLADRPVDEMSAGETRRVIIGRALVHRPTALVLDEPTASLDLRGAHELRGILRKLARSGVTVILVTHHLPDILPEIDRVILLRQGRLFGDGPKARLLNSATMTELFGVPAEVVQRDGYYHLW